MRLLQPLGVEAAIQAITQCEHQSCEKQRQIELALEQARYGATRARRQYDAVDPDNRLVAGELERRWNATGMKSVTDNRLTQLIVSIMKLSRQHRECSSDASRRDLF